jgi:D-alanine-D-alanine ligase
MAGHMRVAVIYGGPSAEHEVSVVSAKSVIAAIDPDRYEVVPIAVTKDRRWLLPARSPAELTDTAGSLPAVGDEGTELVPARPTEAAGPIDVVFPVLHGPYGEDGTVQGMLELAGIPYVGAGVAASALGMDKALQKTMFRARGIPVVEHVVVREADRADVSLPAGMRFPVFTKPARLGSSVGISKCRNKAELEDGLAEAFRYDDKALVEAAVEGRELECAVLGNDEPEASVVGEIIPAHEFYDYEAKYLIEGSELVIPARLPDRVSEHIRELSLEAFRAIDCAGMARVDFFYDENADQLFINEINTIPGFTPISMYPKLWEASGIPYAKLIDRLIELALDRHRRA